MENRRNFIKKTALGITYMGLSNPIDIFDQDVQRDSIQYCRQSYREIPVIADVDVLVIGGSSGAVAAAAEASRSGSKVFLISYEPYLGSDICGYYQLWLDGNETPSVDLAKRIFPSREIPTPMHVKTCLDNELINNNVDFLFSSFVTDIIVDGNNKPYGIVIANRSGRQAIKAKVIIDSSERAIAARLAGAEFSNFKPGKYPFKYVVIGNNPIPGPDAQIKSMPSPIVFKNNTYKAYEYTFNLFLKDLSHNSLMNVENIIRDKTWDPNQVGSSDSVFLLSPVHIKGNVSYKENSKNISLWPVNSFKPQGIDNIYVLSSCADIPTDLALFMNRPVNAMELGCIIGKNAANDAKPKSQQNNFHVHGNVQKSGSSKGDIRELLQPVRASADTKMIPCPSTDIPVIGNYDVVVMGGGTAGACAAISAARNGAKILVLEYLHGLGGIGTMGLIGLYFFGNRKGFTSQLDKAVTSMAPPDHPRQFKKEDLISYDSYPVGVHYMSDWKIECYRKEIRKAGGEIWFGVIGTGAYVENNIVKGVVISTPEGRGIVLAKIVIDSSGSADIAIAAGSDYDFTSKNEFAIQGAGLPKKDPGDHFFNTDWTFINDSDILDVTRVFVEGKIKFPDNYDLGQLPQTRERRRIKGRYTVSVYDILNSKHYSDTISHHISAFDTHGYTLDPYFTLKPPADWKIEYKADVPLRSLLPAKLDGIIVTGLGVSASRDAMPVIRMQACLQNQGYAVGCLAAMAIKENKPVQEVDIRKIQKHLIEIGSLPERVLTDTDSPEFTDEQLKDSSIKVADNYSGLELLLTKPEKSAGLIENQLKNSADKSSLLTYSTILGILGNKSGWENMVDEVENYPGWDKGWNFRVMGNEGPNMSRLDGLITALGKTRVKAALPCILKKAELLKPDDYFSHFRSVALACEYIADPTAVPVLCKLLNIPGFQNNAVDNFKTARSKVVKGESDTSLRSRELIEIFLARALYRCGDYEGLGKRLLSNYAKGLQGHYYLHAYGILKDEKV